MSTITSTAPAAGRAGYGPRGRSPWLDIDWRVYQRWVEIDGRPVNVIDIGSGDAEPIVFVHGLAGSWQNWLEQVPVFARERRVVALDLPGFGASPMPRDQITISGYARIVSELCKTLGLGTVVLVGNSMGGFISAELAIADPQRVAKLVLVSAAGITSENLALARVIPLLRATQTGLIFITGWVATHSNTVVRHRALRRATMRAVVAHPDGLPAALVTEQLRGSGKPGFIDAFYALTHYAIRDRLGKIGVPTLIVWGDRDRLVPTRDAFVFDALIPDSRLVIYEDTGHVSMLERPERFNADLEAFLLEG